MVDRDVVDQDVLEDEALELKVEDRTEEEEEGLGPHLPYPAWQFFCGLQ